MSTLYRPSAASGGPRGQPASFLRYLAVLKPTSMQQEDDLRALEKIVQFARALGIVFLGLNSYWFCYDWFAHHALTTPVVDRIFWNLQQSTGLFTWSSITKFCALFFWCWGATAHAACGTGNPRSVKSFSWRWPVSSCSSATTRCGAFPRGWKSASGAMC